MSRAWNLSSQTVLVGGNVISRQRPPTAKGTCFIIPGDGTGGLPAAIVPTVYEKHHEILRTGALLIEVWGMRAADRD